VVLWYFVAWIRAKPVIRDGASSINPI